MATFEAPYWLYNQPLTDQIIVPNYGTALTKKMKTVRRTENNFPVINIVCDPTNQRLTVTKTYLFVLYHLLVALSECHLYMSLPESDQLRHREKEQLFGANSKTSSPKWEN